jgi:hypothetical protein
LKKVIVFIVLAVFVATAAIFAPTFYEAARPIVPRLLDLGEKHLLELNYVQAIATFTKLIEIDPKNERAYLGLAEAYLENGKPEKAIGVLRDGLEQLPDSAAIKALLEELAKSAEPEPSPAPTSTPIPTPEPVNWKEIYAQFIQDLDYLHIGAEDPYLNISYEDMGDDNDKFEVRKFQIHDVDGDGIPELMVQKSALHYSHSDMYTAKDGSIQFLGSCGFSAWISSDANFPGPFETNGGMDAFYLFYYSLQNGMLVSEEVRLWEISYADDGYSTFETVTFETSNAALLEASKSIEPLEAFIGREAIMEKLGATLITSHFD